MSPEAPPQGRARLFWSIALGGMAFDLATKSWIFARFPLGQPRPLLDGILELHPTQNRGALWGFGSGLPHSSLVFASLSIIAGLAIVFWLFVRGAARDRGLTVALALIMAGALGNCFDRLRFGYVRDFVHFHVDPVLNIAIFNFADNMLVAGALGLLVLALRPEHREAVPAPAADPGAVGGEGIDGAIVAGEEEGLVREQT